MLLPLRLCEDPFRQVLFVDSILEVHLGQMSHLTRCIMVRTIWPCVALAYINLNNSFFRLDEKFLKLELSTERFKKPFLVTDHLGSVTDDLAQCVNRR